MNDKINKKKFLIDFFNFSKSYELEGYGELKSQMQKDLHNKTIYACSGCRKGFVIEKYKKIILEKYKDYLEE